MMAGEKMTSYVVVMPSEESLRSLYNVANNDHRTHRINEVQIVRVQQKGVPYTSCKPNDGLNLKLIPLHPK